MSAVVVVGLAAFNIGLIFLLLAAPLGVRTVRLSRRIGAPPQRIWDALFPLGREAGWSGEVLRAEPAEGKGRVRVTLSWEGRDGRPIERLVQLSDVVEGRRFGMRVVDDSSLDPSFWSHYAESVDLDGQAGGTQVTLSRTDDYRGAAFLIFRYFALRRQLAKLDEWAATGRYRRGGLFERPSTQALFALLSALILWPFFGLSAGGFAVAAVLTATVALHELGHMAAFRLSGHRSVRMIFIPLLGGIAIGGRPYDSRFEVAFVSLMGAGFSAFLVPLTMAWSEFAAAAGMQSAASVLATFCGCIALFNIANLVPVWKFDGGQVLRQICPNTAVLALASFVLLLAFLAVGLRAGFPQQFLVAGGAVFAILSLITAGSGVKPRHELRPIGALERLAVAAALVAVFAVHAHGLVWASGQLS